MVFVVERDARSHVASFDVRSNAGEKVVNSLVKKGLFALSKADGGWHVQGLLSDLLRSDSTLR